MAVIDLPRGPAIERYELRGESYVPAEQYFYLTERGRNPSAAARPARSSSSASASDRRTRLASGSPRAMKLKCTDAAGGAARR